MRLQQHRCQNVVGGFGQTEVRKESLDLQPDLRNWFSGAVRLLVVVVLIGLAILSAWVFLSDDW